MYLDDRTISLKWGEGGDGWCLLKWLNQASKVSGRVLGGVDFASFYGFSIEF
jgi:hypothetical protein